MTDLFLLGRDGAESLAKGMGLSADDTAILVEDLLQSVRYDRAAKAHVVLDANNNPAVVVTNDGTVSDVTLPDFLERAAARLGATKASSKPKQQAKGTGSLTDRMRNAIANRNADKKALAAAEAARGQNPWKEGHINRSRQGLLSNLDPALAARLKQEAAR